MQQKSRTLILALAVCATSLPSIATSPHDTYLHSTVRDSWSANEHFPSAMEEGAEDVNARWWTSFGDTVLDSLIQIGINNNYDLAMAARRIEIARNQVRMTASNYYPQIGLSAGYSRSRTSGATGSTVGPASVGSAFAGTVTMSWEPDIFGKITAQTLRDKASVAVSRAEYGGAMIALEAEIASTYLQLRSYQAQKAIADAHSVSQERIVHITEVRHETGLASMLDVAQAKTLYYSTQAQVPLLESSITACLNSLGVLLAVSPDELPAQLRHLAPLPDCYHLVSVGVPLDLLRRRPDVVQAERSIDVAAAALGIARKEYLPSLTIDGSIGTQAHRVGDLFTNSSFTYSIAPTLSWTVFDGLHRRYNAANARQQLENAVDSYNLTVLTAVEEVDNAMSRYLNNLRYIADLQLVVENSRKAEELSIDLYKQGLTPFSNVVDAQLNLLTYQNTLVTAQNNSLSALVDLYKALGGGWSEK